MQLRNNEERGVWAMAMAAIIAQCVAKAPAGQSPGSFAGTLADECVVEFRKRTMEDRE